MIHSFLIADHSEYGKDQVISRTIKYPWNDCKVKGELEKENAKIIADALSLAKSEGYYNIREVRKTFKTIWKNGCYQNIQVGKQKVIPFKHQS